MQFFHQLNYSEFLWPWNVQGRAIFLTGPRTAFMSITSLKSTKFPF